MAGKNLETLGLMMSGVGSSLSGNPMYLEGAQASIDANRRREHETALDKLMASLNQEPRAATPQGPQVRAFKAEDVGIPELPGFNPAARFTPSEPVPQVSRQAVPAFGQNPGVGGNYAPDALPGARADFADSLRPLMTKAFPAQMLQSLIPQPLKVGFAKPGETPIDERTGKPIGPQLPFAPQDDFKIGQTRTIQRGDKKIEQEYAGNHVWNDLSSGPAFAPTQEPPPVEIDDPTSPTGRRLVPRAQALNQPGPSQQSPQASANTLRDEFNKQTEQVRTVASMYRNGVKGAASASGAGDMNLIYSFMKALDPGSSVKEGEYAQGENLTGAYGKFWQSYNKAKDGEKLLPEVRADILGQLKNIYTSHLPSYAATKQRYSDIATRQRVKPEDVVTDLPAVDDVAATNKAPEGTPSATDAQGNKIYYYGGKWQR